jgi:hypothetical protein
MTANRTASLVETSKGKSASLKNGPLEVPPRMSKQGIAVCAVFFMIQRGDNRLRECVIVRFRTRSDKDNTALSVRTEKHTINPVMAK